MAYSLKDTTSPVHTICIMCKYNKLYRKEQKNEFFFVILPIICTKDFMYKRITIKIGSNVLTRSDGSLDVTRMSALVDQIATLRHQGIEIILVSSGAMASGRSELGKSVDQNRLDSVEQRQLFSAVGQAKLINRYFDLFRDYGIPVGQVLTTKESLGSRGHYLNQRGCMMVMLDNGVLPIVNENDTISVTELMFTDNDELSGLIATMMDAEALIILSNIDGIFTGSPSDPEARLIRKVEPDKDLSGYIQTEKSGFGRGGMKTKSNIARRVAKEGIPVFIANGKADNILTRLVNDPEHTPCTAFVPAEVSVSSMKKWIANSEGFAKGEIHLNLQLTDTLCNEEKATSILPIGVTAIKGDFERNDIVRIIGADGKEIGVGRTAYSSEEARQLIGQRNKKALVHYDYLYIQ